MNTLPDPKDVTTKHAAEILLEYGWTIYPYAIPYGEFFYIPTSTPDHYSFAVASIAYIEFWKHYQSMPLFAHIPPQINTRPTPRAVDGATAPIGQVAGATRTATNAWPLGGLAQQKGRYMNNRKLANSIVSKMCEILNIDPSQKMIALLVNAIEQLIAAQQSVQPTPPLAPDYRCICGRPYQHEGICAPESAGW
jgi:hypothetical protein